MQNGVQPNLKNGSRGSGPSKFAKGQNRHWLRDSDSIQDFAHMRMVLFGGFEFLRAEPFVRLCEVDPPLLQCEIIVDPCRIRSVLLFIALTHRAHLFDQKMSGFEEWEELRFWSRIGGGVMGQRHLKIDGGSRHASFTHEDIYTNCFIPDHSKLVSADNER